MVGVRGLTVDLLGWGCFYILSFVLDSHFFSFYIWVFAHLNLSFYKLFLMETMGNDESAPKMAFLGVKYMNK